MTTMKPSFFPTLLALSLITGCINPRTSTVHKAEAPVSADSQPADVAVNSARDDDGYMRIIGDLRWDKLTSEEEWARQMPNCATKATKRFKDYELTVLTQINTALAKLPKIVNDPSNLTIPEIEYRDLKEVAQKIQAGLNDDHFRFGYYQEPASFRDVFVDTTSIRKHVTLPADDVAIPATPVNGCDLDVGGIKFIIKHVSTAENPSLKSGRMTTGIDLLIPSEPQRRAFIAAFQEKYPPVIDEAAIRNREEKHCSRYTCLNSSDSSLRLSPTAATISLLDSVKVDADKF